MKRGTLFRWRLASDPAVRDTPAWIGLVAGESGKPAGIAVISRDALMYRLRSGDLLGVIPRNLRGHVLEEPS